MAASGRGVMLDISNDTWYGTNTVRLLAKVSVLPSSTWAESDDDRRRSSQRRVSMWQGGQEVAVDNYGIWLSVE